MLACRTLTTTAAIAFVLAACATGAISSAQQSRSVQTARLDARIGPADAQRYEPIRDGRDWQNPFLVIHRDGVEISSKRPEGRVRVAVADVDHALIGLPVAAWPYGRVVAVKEISLRAPDRLDDKPIADNLRATLDILNRLGVTVERWPT